MIWSLQRVSLLMMPLLFASVAMPQSCTPPPSGIVGWWPGDGNANDIVGGDNGTIAGNGTFAPGMVGEAFSFDGVNGAVQMPNSDALQPVSAISVVAWVNPTAFPNLATIVEKFGGGTNNSWFLGAPGALNGAIEWDVIDPSGKDHAYFTAPSTLVTGKWQLVAATFDSSTQEFAVYVDGNVVSLTCGPYACGPISSINQTTATVQIGAYTNPATDGVWRGLIDEVQVFNRALSASEIQAIYSASAAGECKSLPTLTVSSRMGIYKAGGYNDESDAIPPANYTIQAGTVPSISFSGITGLWTCHSGDPTYGPDGTSGTCNVRAGRHVNPTGPFSGYGTTDFTGGLVGMFLGDALPTSPAPSLQFYASQASAGGIQTTFRSLSPAIGQVFFIGDGLTGTGTGSVQTFQVPPAATHLYLGYVDSCDGQVLGCYGDNTGSVAVTVSDSCGFSVSTTSQSFPAGGGTGTIIVTTLLPPSSCGYSVQANDSWIHSAGSCTSGHSLCIGNGVFDTIEPNAGPNQRIGTLTVAGQIVTVTQAGTATCTYGINPTGQTFSENGGRGTVSITAQTGCSWSAVSNEGWVTINSGSSGSGSGTANFTVAANSGTPRDGALTIAGQTYSVTQTASGCGATDVTNKVSVAASPFLPGDTLLDDYWVQTVTLFNHSSQIIPGPIYLVMDGLPRTGYPCTENGVSNPTCNVIPAPPVTYCGSPAGSDLVLFSSGSMAPAQPYIEQLQFLPPPGGLDAIGSSGANKSFAYTARVFSGMPTDINGQPGGIPGNSPSAGPPVSAASAAGTHPTVTYWLSLNTATLIGHPAGPFAVGFQLASGDVNGNNTAALGSFQFGASGAPSQAAVVTGSAFGDLNTTVSLTDNDPVNFFYQAFTPGDTLTFPVTFTTNTDTGGMLDELVFYILDNTLTPIPTMAGTPLDIFSSINLTAKPVLQIYASDSSRSPVGGGGPISIAAPLVVGLSASSVNFGGQPAGTTSRAQNIRVTNAGNIALTISGITVAGTDASDFTQTNTCPSAPSTLTLGANCTISVTFTPSAAGNRQATLSISDDEAAPQTVALSGKGT